MKKLVMKGCLEAILFVCLLAGLLMSIPKEMNARGECEFVQQEQACVSLTCGLSCQLNPNNTCACAP
jgi:hypothetical protein